MTLKGFVLLCLGEGWLLGYVFSAVLFYFGSKVFSDQGSARHLGICKSVMNKERVDGNIWKCVVRIASLKAR